MPNTVAKNLPGSGAPLAAKSARSKQVAGSNSEKWDKFDVNKWRAAMFSTRSYFKQLYEDTPQFVRRIVASHKSRFPKSKVRLVEVGSGTGEFLFNLAKDVDVLIGVEFNEKFVNFCKEKKDADYADDKIEFVLGDARELVKVLDVTGNAAKSDELLIVACVNNTFGIMPDEMRTIVYDEIVKLMREGQQATSVMMAGYWDGNHFGNSVQNFYGANPILCGNLKDAMIDWDNKVMTTTSGYTTRWTTPEAAYNILTDIGLEIHRIEARSRGVLVDARIPEMSNGLSDSDSEPKDHSSTDDDSMMSSQPSSPSREFACVENSITSEQFEVVGLSTESEHVSQNYYDSEDAFKFYTHVWGGDNIHIGCYDDVAALHAATTTAAMINAGQPVDESVQTVRSAGERVLELLVDKVEIKSDWQVMDMGSALGGFSRYLAQNYGCSVIGVDLSVKECERNVQRTLRAGLSHLVGVKCCSFTDTGEEAGSLDLVVSEDSFLHAGKYRAHCLEETARLLKPGGYLVFTDPMEADDVDKASLQPIYDRIHLENMGSVAFYKDVAKKTGLEFVSFEPMVEHLRTHYATVLSVLKKKKHHLVNEVGISKEYVDNMIKGLDFWVDGADKGLLNYGILVFRKAQITIKELKTSLQATIKMAEQLELQQQHFQNN